MCFNFRNCEKIISNLEYFYINDKKTILCWLLIWNIIGYIMIIKIKYSVKRNRDILYQLNYQKCFKIFVVKVIIVKYATIWPSYSNPKLIYLKGGNQKCHMKYLLRLNNLNLIWHQLTKRNRKFYRKLGSI